MTSQKSIISQNILRRMEDLGIKNRVALSERSGVSRTVITNIIAMPTKSVMVDTAINLAEALECRVKWLCSNEGPMNDDEIEKKFAINNGVPLLQLSDVSDQETTKRFLSELDESAQRIPCPSGNKESVFGVTLSSVSYRANLGNYDRAGIVYFDFDVEPLSGQWVIAQLTPDSRPEVMEFIAGQGRMYLNSIEMNTPDQYKPLEIKDRSPIVATKVSYSIMD